MLYLTYTLDIVILLALPIFLGILLVRRFDLEGRWWWIGAIVFILSQIIFQPLQIYVLNPFLNNLSFSGRLPSVQVLILGGLLVGLSAGLCEELLRYAMFRWWAKDARSFMAGMLLGIGQGGAASIILGLLVLYNFVNMALVRNIDPTTLVASDQVEYVRSQITAFWSVPWYYSLREVIGQVFMLVIQICLAIMILQIFIRKQWFWLILAISFHTLVEATRVILQNLSDELLANLALAFFAIAGVSIVLSFRNKPFVEPALESSPRDRDEK